MLQKENSASDASKRRFYVLKSYSHNVLSGVCHFISSGFSGEGTSLRGRKFSDCKLMAPASTMSYPLHGAYYHVVSEVSSFHHGDIWLGLHLLSAMMPYDPKAWSHHLKSTASSKAFSRPYPFSSSFMVEAFLLLFFYFRLSSCVGVFCSKEIGLTSPWPPSYCGRDMGALLYSL